MRTFTKFLVASAAAASLAAFAPAANAAVFVHAWTVASNGEITVTFGDTQISDADASGIDNGTAFTHSYAPPGGDPGTFTDTFDFVLPTGTVFNIASSTSTLSFTGISFDGIVGTVSNNPHAETASVAGVSVVSGGPQHLIVTGDGVASAGWAGTASFVPVPEPATWGLMIMGFGGVGALLRNRRRQVTFA